MDKQIIEVNHDNFSLFLYRNFLIVENTETHNKSQLDLDTILSLVISANDVILSKNVINAICEKGANIILCDKNYLPSSIITCCNAHWLIAPRMKNQIACSKPLQKKLWQNIVQNKIINQAKILKYYFPDHPAVSRLQQLAKKTLSDDAGNTEGQAASVYFKALFGPEFVRNRMQKGVNALLNYTYIVLRAMVARAVVGNGLLTCLGIKHCMITNPMPLVDDVIEPFRPIADRIIFDVIQKQSNKESIILSPEIKRELTSIISFPVTTEKGKISLCDAIYSFVGSLVKSYEDKTVELKYPQF